MIELFTNLGSEGRTVVVSSHVLDEVERLASRVLVMGKGRLLAEGDAGFMEFTAVDDGWRLAKSGHTERPDLTLTRTGDID